MDKLIILMILLFNLFLENGFQIHPMLGHILWQWVLLGLLHFTLFLMHTV
jgi:hypothetical protein